MRTIFWICGGLQDFEEQTRLAAAERKKREEQEEKQRAERRKVKDELIKAKKDEADERLKTVNIDEMTSKYKHIVYYYVHKNNKRSWHDVARDLSVYLSEKENEDYMIDLGGEYGKIENPYWDRLASSILFKLEDVDALVTKEERDRNGNIKGEYLRRGRGDFYYDPSSSSLPVKMPLYLIDKMNGHEFEQYCAYLLRNSGYTNVKVTKGSGDQGVDIIANKFGLKYAIQCKRYSSPVGNKPVQEVNAGKQFYHCDIAAVITNQYFTEGAKELAKVTGVRLWDRSKLGQPLD